MSSPGNSRIVNILVLNVIFILMLGGCYSSMHQGSVIDGANITVAFRPINHASPVGLLSDSRQLEYSAFSIALRYGWAASRKGKCGHSAGVVLNWGTKRRGIKRYMPHILGSYYFQFPQNSYLDIGIGGEFCILPPIPMFSYIVMSRDIGKHATVYSELRAAGLPVLTFLDKDKWMVLNLGTKLDVLKHLSLFGEYGFCYDTIDHSGFIRRDKVAPVMGLGVTGAIKDMEKP